MSQDKLIEKFRTLESLVNAEVLERRQEIHTAILALLCRKHHFQVGPPGEAKSLLIERISSRIEGLGDEGYFRYLLTQYTQPDELFGGPDFLLLKDQGIYKRVTKKKLPRARIAFLDELLRGNSSILNTLLAIMNERIFDNGDDDTACPLDTMFAASNSMPDEADLNAMWDRLHFRHVVSPLNESSNFVRMMSTPMVKNPEAVIDLEDLIAAQNFVAAVQVPDNVLDAIRILRDDMSKVGIEPTSRRWKDCVSIIQAEAWLNGRQIADTEDVRPLMHVLWDQDEQRKPVRQLVLQLANPLDREVSDALDGMYELQSEYNKLLKSNPSNDKEFVTALAEIYGKIERVIKGDSHSKGFNHLKKEIEESGRESMLIDDLKAIIEELGGQVQSTLVAKKTGK